MDVPAGIPINEYIAGSHPGAPALWKFCQSCLKLFKDLIAMVLQASNISISVKPYFDPIIRHLDNNLIRLEIWIFDTGIDDKDFRQASMKPYSDIKLERCVTGILEDTISQLKIVEERVEHMRAVASAILKASDQSLKRNYQLDEVVKQIDNSCQHIASAVHDLVDLTEAVQMYLATRYQCGPLAGLREKIGTTRSQVPVTMDSSREEGPWTRKNLLTIDAGGVKNYSTLLILKDIMRHIAQIEQDTPPSARSSVFPLGPRPQDLRDSTAPATSEHFPCHYFDYIAGAGFGGILAIMLGRLRMTVDDCLEAYELLLERVFSSRRMRHKLLPSAIAIASGGIRYDHRPLEQELKRIIKASQAGSSFRQLNEAMCRTIVIASKRPRKPGYEGTYLFRSYHHPKTFPENTLERNPGSPDDHRIWQIGRATSAAPAYFEPMRLEEPGEMSEYTAWDKNNPSAEAYESVKQMNHNDPKTVKVLVSIGTGRNPEAGSSFKNPFKILNLIRNAELVHCYVFFLLKNNAEYFRFNVDHGLGTMKFDEWKGERGEKTLGLIRAKTEEYLKSPNVKREIAETARHLVETRRQRSSWEPDLDRWERFCHGVEYACPIPNCNDGAQRRKDRLSLRDHLRDTHATETDKLQSLLDAGKRFPLDEVLE